MVYQPAQGMGKWLVMIMHSMMSLALRQLFVYQMSSKLNLLDVLSKKSKENTNQFAWSAQLDRARASRAIHYAVKITLKLLIAWIHIPMRPKVSLLTGSEIQTTTRSSFSIHLASEILQDETQSISLRWFAQSNRLSTYTHLLSLWILKTLELTKTWKGCSRYLHACLEKDSSLILFSFSQDGPLMTELKWWEVRKEAVKQWTSFTRSLKWCLMKLFASLLAVTKLSLLITNMQTKSFSNKECFLKVNFKDSMLN